MYCEYKSRSTAVLLLLLYKESDFSGIGLTELLKKLNFFHSEINLLVCSNKENSTF